MTIIVWDGVTLAADKLCSIGGLSATVNKLFRIDTGPFAGSIGGGSGDASSINEFVKWLRDGADMDKIPKFQTDKDDYVNFILINAQKEIWRFDRGAFPYMVEDEYHASGSGRDYALAAMYCGKTAAEAVEIASIFETGCGRGVDTLTL